MKLRETEVLRGPIAEIQRCLRDGGLDAAGEHIRGIVRSRDPEVLSQALPQLDWIFERDWPSAPAPEARFAFLADLLWENREPALNDMYVVGYFMRFCRKSDKYGRFRPAFRSWIASNWTPDFKFSGSGNFSHFGELLREQKRDFADAKYRRWADFESQNFFQAVRGFSKFATVSSWITDFLFEHRSDKAATLQQWTRGLRSAETWKHILADADTLARLVGSRESPVHYPRLPELPDLVDVELAESLFAGLDLSRGLLLCTIHHAYLRLARECATLCMPEHHMLTRGPGEKNISTKDDGALSVFKAIKILRDRKMLLMVPDARAGLLLGEKEASQVTILGRPRLFADGAPTIAFESGCATGWYMMVRERDRFVPVYEPGPSRKAKESFASFKERWWAFYAGQIENLLTGDPRNIALSYNRRFLGPLPLATSAAGEDGDGEEEAD